MAIPVGVYLTVLVAAMVVSTMHTGPQNFVTHLADSQLFEYVFLFASFYAIFGVIFHFLLISVFSYGLYRDVNAGRDAPVDWTPDRRLWTGVAVAHLLAVFVIPALVTVPAGIVYLYTHHHHVSTA